jgi:hypothetical protein
MTSNMSSVYCSWGSQHWDRSSLTIWLLLLSPHGPGWDGQNVCVYIYRIHHISPWWWRQGQSLKPQTSTLHWHCWSPERDFIVYCCHESLKVNAGIYKLEETVQGNCYWWFVIYISREQNQDKAIVCPGSVSELLPSPSECMNTVTFPSWKGTLLQDAVVAAAQ